MSHASRRGREEEEEGECRFYDALPDLKDDADSLQPQQPEAQQGAGRDGPSSRSGTPLKQGRPHGDGGDDDEEEGDGEEEGEEEADTEEEYNRCMYHIYPSWGNHRL